MRNSLFYSFITLLCFYSCTEPENIRPEPDDNPEPVDSETIAINNWIYDILDEVYLWEKDLPRSIDPTVQKDSKNYFHSMLSDEDNWSYITSNYDELINELDGIYKTFGFNYKFYYKNDNEYDIIALVSYVIPNSPAEDAGVKRGHMISVVNGTSMNIDNYNSALSVDIATMKLEKYNETTGEFEEDKTVSITKETVEEDPIFMAKTFDQNGTKIGYLVYNSFIWTTKDSTNLANTFIDFKAEGIDELVLDLRYNGGGANNAAVYLSSMIAPSSVVSNEKVLCYNIYNDTYTKYFSQTHPEQLENRFTKDVPVNLDLKRVYILTTNSTASASELVTIGLEPYMDVIQIGQNSYGKYTSMWLLNDQNDGKTHSWGMLPVIAKYSNSEYYTDFIDGLEPDYTEKDGYQYALGDENEWMLNTALSKISGDISLATKSARITPFKEQIGKLGGNPILNEGILYKEYNKQ